MDPWDLSERFNFHPANDKSGPKHQAVRDAHLLLAQVIDELVPEGREKSLAITKLEEAMFWSNAGIARK